MKIWLALVAALAVVYGDDKPGDCPNATVVISLETCTDDFDCSGTNKCCGSVCTPPVCNDDDDDDDDDNVQCLVNPCESATCSAIPDAVCLRMSKKDKKAKHKAKNVAWLKKLWAEKAEDMEAKRDAKLANWETIGKQDKVDKFTKKWDRNNTPFEGKRKGKWGKKAHLSQGKHQKKQQWKEMTPEERYAEKMARKQAHFERKEEKKAEKREKKMGKHSRRQKKMMRNPDL